MRFMHVDPTAKTAKHVEAEDWRDVVPNIGNVDHGTVTHDHKTGHGVAIFVYEYGLMEGNGPYFVLNHQLYSGEAVLFAFDEAGETIDMPESKHGLEPLWLADKQEVELAIMAGLVDRPEARINGVLTWRWS